MGAVGALDRRGREVLHPRSVHPPRQIYASAADRRRGRRWSRRHRPLWVPAALVAGATTVALVAGEVLRSIA
jgi:uncharacterized membrane protein